MALRSQQPENDPLLAWATKPPPPKPSDRFREWFVERLGKATDRRELYSLAILLQHQYFFYRRREPAPEVRDALHSAYERSFDELEMKILETDAPLPVLEASAPATPPVPPDYTELWWADEP